MSHRFDATLKDIVADHAADYAAVLGLPANEPATPINVDLSTVSAATDVALVWRQPVDGFLRGGVGTLPLAPLCAMPAGRPVAESLREVVREIECRLAKEATHAEAARLMTAAYILTGLRVKKGELSSIYRGIGLMHESTAYDEILEEGEIKHSHRILLRLGRKRLGPPDAAVEGELTAIRDLDRLDRLADAVLTATSWQELLATP